MGKKELAPALASELSGRERRPSHSAVLLLAVGIILLIAGFVAFLGPAIWMDLGISSILRSILVGFLLLGLGGMLIGAAIIMRAGTHWLPRAAMLMKADAGRKGEATGAPSRASAQKNIAQREASLQQSARDIVL
jgi:hypothetical protein